MSTGRAIRYSSGMRGQQWFTGLVEFEGADGVAGGGCEGGGDDLEADAIGGGLREVVVAAVGLVELRGVGVDGDVEKVWAVPFFVTFTVAVPAVRASVRKAVMFVTRPARCA